MTASAGASMPLPEVGPRLRVVGGGGAAAYADGPVGLTLGGTRLRPFLPGRIDEDQYQRADRVLILVMEEIRVRAAASRESQQGRYAKGEHHRTHLRHVQLRNQCRRSQAPDRGNRCGREPVLSGGKPACRYRSPFRCRCDCLHVHRVRIRAEPADQGQRLGAPESGTRRNAEGRSRGEHPGLGSRCFNEVGSRSSDFAGAEPAGACRGVDARKRPLRGHR